MLSGSGRCGAGLSGAVSASGSRCQIVMKTGMQISTVNHNITPPSHSVPINMPSTVQHVLENW